MVSNASDDFPEPLKPVITTSLSRGIESVRFFRLCSRAPPILMKSLATGHEFLFQNNQLLYWKSRRNPPQTLSRSGDGWINRRDAPGSTIRREDPEQRDGGQDTTDPAE